MYIGRSSGLESGLYTISIMFPSAPLTSLACAHMLTVSIMHSPLHKSTFFGSWSSLERSFWLLRILIAVLMAIGWLSCFNIILLCAVTVSFVAKMWIELSNSLLSPGGRQCLHRVISRSQSGCVGSALRILLSTCLKCNYVGPSPCWRNMVCNVTIVVNSLQIARVSECAAYRGLSNTRGSCARSPVRMMDLPPKWVDYSVGNVSHSLVSIFRSSLGPMKLISSIRMYLIYFMPSWNVVSACPLSGCKCLIGILSAECIVVAFMYCCCNHSYWCKYQDLGPLCLNVIIKWIANACN